MSQYKLRNNTNAELGVHINYGGKQTQNYESINYVRTPTQNYESI